MKRTREEVMNLIKQNLASIRQYGVRRLGLVGSCARGENTETSDLDFIVDFEKETFDAYMGLKFFLEDLFGCRVDLGMVETIRPEFREAMLREALYVEGL